MIDLRDPAVRHHRSWGWFVARLSGLFTMPPAYSAGFGGVMIVHRARIAAKFNPPEFHTGKEG